MDHHKILYKDSRSQTPLQYNLRNRELQVAKRCKQRRDRFQDSRNISPSPTPLKKEIIIPLCTSENKENNGQQNVQKSTRLAKIVCNSANPEKLTKQEQFLKRFVEYMEKKKTLKQQMVVKNKKKPFVSAVNSSMQNSATSFACSTLVPKGHPEVFRPPNGLKTPFKDKGRQSIYTTVPTPPRKTAQTFSKPLTTNKYVNKPAVDTIKPIFLKTPVDNASKKINVQNTVKAIEMPKPSVAPQNNKLVLRNDLKPRALKLPPPPNSAKSSTKKATEINSQTNFSTEKPTEAKKLYPVASGKNKQGGATAKIRSMAAKFTENVKPIKKSPLKSGRTGLSQNLKAKNKKPLNNSKRINLPSLQINGKKLLNLVDKKKSPVDEIAIQTPKDFTLLNPFEPFVTSTRLRNSSEIVNDSEGKTPKDSSNSRKDNSSAKRNILMEAADNLTANELRKDLVESINKYNFVRYSEATTVSNNDNKDSEDEATCNVLSDEENKTLVENAVTDKKTLKVSSNSGKDNNSSAKRNILMEAPDNLTANELRKDLVESINKYNFVRYSVATNVSSNDNKDSDDEAACNGLSDKENKTLVENAVIDEKTPTKSGGEEKPSNYLSPFVSVARGKVSLKIEKEKRNSIYLQTTEDDKSSTLNCSQKYSVEVRRTLEAVNYFRKQLQDEVDRLHRLCDIWESYKTENYKKIQNANGEDMINVSVGQTRLLTSKKFMQFKGLIDRCEAGATGIGAVEYDGSEDTKPITSEDLEGFWSMLGIQVDNLHKRFDNLERWKSNNWQDPDEVKPKIKKISTKVVKKSKPVAKAKPNSALQQMLRKMQAEMRKNKNNKEGDIDIVVTPSKQKSRRSTGSNNSTPTNSMDNSTTRRRLSIVVKDRKYFSPTATILSISSPNRRTSITQQSICHQQDSPKMLNHIKMFNEALDKMETCSDLRKSVLINGNSRRMSLNSPTPNLEANTINDRKHTPKPSERKSILKTPGTAKSRLRNVIFNEKLRVKKFNFLIDDEGGDGLNVEENGNDTHEEDLAKSEDFGTTEYPTLTLRNRKVRLRPSCEIVIPMK